MELPKELLLSHDRNSMRVKRLCFALEQYQKKDPKHPAIEPMLRELNMRLSGKHMERYKRRGAVVGVDKVVKR